MWSSTPTPTLPRFAGEGDKSPLPRREGGLGGGAAALLLLAVSACGFQPLYAERTADSALGSELASVKVMQISERYGQEMTNTLRDGLNPYAVSVPAAYELNVALKEQTADLMIRQDATASRTDVSLYATWSLRRVKDNHVVLSGSSRSLTGHDVLNNEYANVVSTNTNIERAVRDVSDDIETRLAIFFRHSA